MPTESVPPKKLKYRCPNCGRWGTFGEHYWTVDSTASGAKKGFFNLKYVLSASVAIVLIIAFLGGSAGVYSLGILLLIPLIWLLLRVGKKQSDFGGDYKELVLLVRQDRELAERLIGAEQQKFPGENRQQSISRALEKLKYDRLR